MVVIFGKGKVDPTGSTADAPSLNNREKIRILQYSLIQSCIGGARLVMLAVHTIKGGGASSLVSIINRSQQGRNLTYTKATSIPCVSSTIVPL